MSHPKICPCPNCALGGSKGPLAVVLAVVGAAAVAMVKWGQLPLGLTAKTIQVTVAAVAVGLFATLITVAIRGSVRSGRQGEAPVVPESKSADVPVAVEPEPEPVAPALPKPSVEYGPAQPLTPRLRLVRKDVA